ncbi:hypothetical protein [Streptomyces antibioticus]|uniref:hypothetical protein n=1 Tax=Streptomyces antibioticus TaxID=1890 RepID=UPI0033AA4D67
MTSQPTRPWTHTLTDSVYALGAAAREHQAAYRAAVLAQAHVDLDRLRLLNGKVTITSAGRGEQEPHLAALNRIGDVLSEARDQLERLYTNAAEAYAHGAQWAAREVLLGKEPAHVELYVGENGLYRVPEYVPVLPVEKFSNGKALEAARRRYERCLVAGYEAEGIGSQEYVSDHDAGVMHEALDIAAGLADAAYAYGVLAEGAVHFAINTRQTS